MDKVFEDYLNKKSDIIENGCSCGDDSFIFLDSVATKYFTICRKCGKRIYHTTCEDPKCGTGFAIPEDDKQIDLVNRTWKCSVCKKINTHLPEVEIKNYYKSEMPPEILKEEEGRGLPKLVKWGIWLLMASYVVNLLFKLLK